MAGAGSSVQTGSPPSERLRSERFAATFPENEPLLSWLRSEEVEEVLEPEIPIIDTHHHLWDLRGKKYVFGPRGQIVYGLREYLEDMCDGHNVVKTIFMQLSAGGQFPNWKDGVELPEHLKPLAEVEMMQGVAATCAAQFPDQPRICAGIVGYADLCDPKVEELLEAMMRVRNFRAIRFGPADAEDVQFCRGMALLEKHDLAYDWICPETGFWGTPMPNLGLSTLKALALKFPKLRIVVNHFGSWKIRPNMTAEDLAKWKAEISDLAGACPNVYCKCGGVQMVSNGWGWEKRAAPPSSQEICEAVLPFYSHAIDAFGVHRCMFETNFPPDKESVSARCLFNAFKRICVAKGLSAAEKRAIFHDTAVVAYRL